MGCGASHIVKTERSNSHVTIESQQRTVAAYRRQRIARDMEQIAYQRAELEVEKALMLKRGSVDDRRPSYVIRVLEDLAEVEEGQEEVEEEYNDPFKLNGTCYSDKQIEQEKNRNEKNNALHSSVTQHQSVTPRSESEDELKLTTHAQENENLVKQEQHRIEDYAALHIPITQQQSVIPENDIDLARHAQDDNNILVEQRNEERR